MGLSMHNRLAIVRELSPRFRQATKTERSRILDEFVALTGYSRCYAAFVLRSCGRRQVWGIGQKRIAFVPGHARRGRASRTRRSKDATEAFAHAVERLWVLSDGLCGKRLVVFIREIIPHLERQGLSPVADERIGAQLLSVSAATVDRLLTTLKRQAQLPGRTITRPGTLLKHHIPVRTFADWNDLQPGLCEADLVSIRGRNGSELENCVFELT